MEVEFAIFGLDSDKLRADGIQLYARRQVQELSGITGRLRRPDLNIELLWQQTWTDKRPANQWHKNTEADKLRIGFSEQFYCDGVLFLLDEKKRSDHWGNKEKFQDAELLHTGVERVSRRSVGSWNL